MDFPDNPIKDAEGRIVLLINRVEDVTEAHRVGDALERRVRRPRALRHPSGGWDRSRRPSMH